MIRLAAIGGAAVLALTLGRFGAYGMAGTVALTLTYWTMLERCNRAVQ